MKIFFDYKIFFQQKYGGVSKYFIKLSENLIKLDENVVRIISPIYKNRFLKEITSKNFIKFLYLKKDYRYTEYLGSLLNVSFTKFYLYFYKPDILHLTYYSKKLSYKKKFPIVITIYDLIYEKFYKEFNYDKNLKKYFLKIADHIICISNNTKKDLQYFYDIEDKKISVIHLGVDSVKNSQLQKIKIKDPYILYVGDRRRYKNFFKFILAFSLSKFLKNNFKIVCFGGGLFTAEEFNFFKKNGINLASVLQFHGSDDYLNEFYRNSSLFVFPSIYEGFGLPIIEALNMNCAVACSNIHVFKEVGKNLVNYFDPYDEISIKKVMENTILNVKNEKIKIDQNSKKLLELFSWKKCAKETMDVYKKLH
jgi:glycosyltransferase involved in cell wall biosynthesis